MVDLSTRRAQNVAGYTNTIAHTNKQSEHR